MTTLTALTVHQTDAIVIGAGPAGLYSVLELGMNDMKAHVIDILDRAGGQCAELYPEKPIYDIPALPACTGAELSQRLLDQVKPLAPTFHLGQMAEKLEKGEGNRWRVTTDVGTTIEAPVVIVAAGGGSFIPKKPAIPGIEAYENTSVFYLVRQRERFMGKRLVIAGGGDSALDWSINLQDVASHITLVHRRNEFRASPESVNRMRHLVEEGKITLKIANILGLKGDAGQLSAVTLQEDGGEAYDYETDCLLPFYGLAMKLGPVAQFGITMAEGRIPVDPTRYETNLPGVYAIGDICAYEGKSRVILSGFYEASTAVKNAVAYVHPERHHKRQHSSIAMASKNGKVA